MEVLLNLETDFSIPDGFEEECVQLVRFVLTSENAPTESVVSVTLVDADEMAALNGEYRAVPEPTDVLSFPCDPPLMGDIVICPEVAVARHGEVVDALRLMLVHGTLHLLGYDHVDGAEADAMEARQDALLDEWGGR